MIKRLLLGALIALSCASSAFAQQSAIPGQYLPGFRTIDGTKLNKLVNVLNAKQGVCTSGIVCGTGYPVTGQGAGGVVTQATNRTTGVTLNTLAGTITTNNASLAAETAAAFIVTDSQVGINDVVVTSIQSGANGGNTTIQISTITAGTFTIQVANQNASGGTAETGAILINFAVIKGTVN